MKHSAIDMCDHCRTIPWDDSEHWVEDRFLKGLKDAEMLQAASCRICRLIGTATPKHCRLPADLLHLRWYPRTRPPNKGVIGSLIVGEAPFCNGELYLTLQDNDCENTEVQPVIASKRVDFAEIKAWFEDSKAAHPCCEPETSPQLLNLRVIDCVEKTVVVATAMCSYVALSYVWGQLATNDRISESPLALPPTVEDAVVVTRKLGYRYLWVDRYCIDQEDACDKKQQIDQMGLIYASAQITIVAAAGLDPSYGLVGISRDRTTMMGSEPVSNSRSLHIVPLSVHGCIANSVWFSRAWTMQEGFLSKRILCFTEQEALFLCNYDADGSNYGRTECPVDDSDIEEREWVHDSRECVRTALSSFGITPAGAKNLVRQYTQRTLSHDSDALNAIVGTLNVMARNNPPIYHIWGVSFTTDQELNTENGTASPISIALAWIRDGIGFRNRRRFGFPSWSPIGWTESIYHHPNLAITPDFMIRYWSAGIYKDLDSETCSLDYTPLQSGCRQSQYLQITTTVIEADLHVQPHLGYYSHLVKLPFLRLKGEVGSCQERHTNGPFVQPRWDDKIGLDVTLPILYAKAIHPDAIDYPSDCLAMGDRFLLFFQKRSEHYERVGAGEFMILSFHNDDTRPLACNSWEMIPSEEEGSWDQIAQRRTLIVG